MIEQRRARVLFALKLAIVGLLLLNLPALYRTLSPTLGWAAWPVELDRSMVSIGVVVVTAALAMALLSLGKRR